MLILSASLADTASMIARRRYSRLFLSLLAGCTVAGCAHEGGQRVAPKGAPYSYTVPDGFAKGKITLQLANDQRDVTGVALDRDNLLTVYVLGHLTTPVTQANVATYASELDRAIHQNLGGVTISGQQPTTVAGTFAFRYHADHIRLKDGSVISEDQIYIFHGIHEVRVGCQYTPANKVKVLAGCNKLLATLRVS